jgi:hypothetical protein
MTDLPEFRDPGELPVLDWLDKTLIDIDRTYQRGLDEKRVQRILEWFAWDSFGAIVVAPAADGRFHCTDGQHRLEAAKRHPKVTMVPAITIVASGVQAEAENFVSINKDRKNPSPLDIFWAELAANDPEAVTANQVAQRAGVSILRYLAGGTNYQPGHTMAIGTLRSLVDRRGALKARQILELVKPLAPIGAIHIRAAEALLTDGEFTEDIDPVDLADTIARIGDSIESEVGAFAKTHCVPKWRAWASLWFRKTRKKRKAA